MFLLTAYDVAGGQNSGEVVMADSEDAPAYATGGFELALPGQEGGKQRMLGSREFVRYYRQRHRRPDIRTSVAINTVLQQYVVTHETYRSSSRTWNSALLITHYWGQ